MKEIIEKIRIQGDNGPLGYMVLQKDHYEWEVEKGPWTFTSESLRVIADGLDEWNEKLKNVSDNKTDN